MICHQDNIIPQPFLAVSSFVTLLGLALDLISLSFSAGWKLFWDLKARILQSLILPFLVKRHFIEIQVITINKKEQKSYKPDKKFIALPSVWLFSLSFLLVLAEWL